MLVKCVCTFFMKPVREVLTLLHACITLTVLSDFSFEIKFKSSHIGNRYCHHCAFPIQLVRVVGHFSLLVDKMAEHKPRARASGAALVLTNGQSSKSLLHYVRSSREREREIDRSYQMLL